MKKSKVAIVVSQIIEKIEMICGGVGVAFFTSIILYCIFDDVKDGVDVIIIFLVIDLLCVWVILWGIRRKKMRLEFMKYVTYLSNDPTGSLENIAAAAGTSVDIAKKNIDYMLKRKFFNNAYLDEGNNRLVLSSAEHIEINSPAAYNAQPQKTPAYVSLKCPNCGGANKVIQGAITECEYCGSPLQG